KNEPGAEDQLSRLARRADQLPLMQHALNRMWEEARAGLPSSEQSEHQEKPRSTRLRLTLAGYEKIGGLEGALDKHADAVLAGLAAKLGEKVAKTTAGAIFRAVTMGTKAADAVRHPMKFGALVTICGGEAHRAAAHDVVDAFRSEGCNFLQPEIDPNNPHLTNDDFVDITHESLIRQWSRLREWAREEFESAENYRRLEDAAKRHEKGQVDLWTKAELANALAWRDRESVNKDWAGRYGASYQLAMAFLRDSEQAEQQEAAAA